MGKISYNYAQLIIAYEKDLSCLEEDYFQAINNKDWTKASKILEELVFANTLKHYLYFWDKLNLKPYGPNLRTSAPGLDEVVEIAEGLNLKLEVSVAAFAGSKNLEIESSKVIIHNKRGLVLLADLMESLVKARPEIMPTGNAISLIGQKHEPDFECPSLNELIEMACHHRFRLSMTLTA